MLKKAVVALLMICVAASVLIFSVCEKDGLSKGVLAYIKNVFVDKQVKLLADKFLIEGADAKEYREEFASLRKVLSRANKFAHVANMYDWNNAEEIQTVMKTLNSLIADTERPELLEDLHNVQYLYKEAHYMHRITYIYDACDLFIELDSLLVNADKYDVKPVDTSVYDKDNPSSTKDMKSVSVYGDLSHTRRIMASSADVEKEFKDRYFYLWKDWKAKFDELLSGKLEK